jgi:hypothetical protein
MCCFPPRITSFGLGLNLLGVVLAPLTKPLTLADDTGTLSGGPDICVGFGKGVAVLAMIEGPPCRVFGFYFFEHLPRALIHSFFRSRRTQPAMLSPPRVNVSIGVIFGERVAPFADGKLISAWAT